MKVPRKTFLKGVNMPFPMGTYYRVRDNGDIELGYGIEGKNQRDYDCVRLVIKPDSIALDQKEFYEATVMWFRQNGRVYLPKGQKYDDYGKRKESIVLGLDEKLLFQDPKYYAYLMSELLDKNRVERYVQMGMEDAPRQECGNYVGQVAYNSEGELRKYFDVRVGSACHHSRKMEQKRDERKREYLAAEEKKYEEKKKKYNDLKAELEQLQKELGVHENESFGRGK